jgi:methylase of polypeptide subunit release factors
VSDAAITGKLLDFGPLLIEYDERVLVPRPWTEMQSRWAAQLLPGVPDGPVLELCAGPGHIGLLAIEESERMLVQVDAHPVACTYARRNAARAGLGDRVEVRLGMLEAVLGPAERFALVIADPPWVPSAEVTDHPDDPLLAIDGGIDGLALVRTCLEVIGRHLLPGGAAVLQVGDGGQADAVQKFVEARLPGLRVEKSRVVDGGAVVALVSTNPA